MTGFRCSVCEADLAFEATACGRCGTEVGYLPATCEVVALHPTELPEVHTVNGTAARHWRCLNAAWGCNWLVPTDAGTEWCESCRLTHGRPATTDVAAVDAWSSTEALKRRLVHQLKVLGLPVRGWSMSEPDGLRFELVYVPGQPAVTGHLDGTITIDLTEADAVHREQLRTLFAEPVRTVLGHLRHEAGHYYWPSLVDTPVALDEFRDLFGDERADYAGALEAHARTGAPAWDRDRHISAYAAAHPAEDWAECFAHYLLLVDAMETAEAHHLAPTPATGSNPHGIRQEIGRWQELTAGLDAVSAAFGQPPLYPFALQETVVEKLAFVDRRINALRADAGPPAR